MLVFQRQSRSIGHRCEGLQIYSMPTDVYIFLWKQVFESLVTTYSRVKRINRGYVTHYTVKRTLDIRTMVI